MPIQTDTVVERIRQYGVKSASPTDLVAVALSRREDDANESTQLAREILKRYGSIGALSEISTDELRQLTGLDDFELVRFMSMLELGRRSDKTNAKAGLRPADNPADVEELLSHLCDEKQEHFCAIFLDAKLNILRWKTIHIGTLTMSVVGPREVFREAVREGASSIVVAHNHPSGDTTPSPEDIDVTKKLVEIGNMLDIPVVDHVIIGEPGRATSLRMKGYIK